MVVVRVVRAGGRWEGWGAAASEAVPWAKVVEVKAQVEAEAEAGATWVEALVAVGKEAREEAERVVGSRAAAAAAATREEEGLGMVGTATQTAVGARAGAATEAAAVSGGKLKGQLEVSPEEEAWEAGL